MLVASFRELFFIFTPWTEFQSQSTRARFQARLSCESCCADFHKFPSNLYTGRQMRLSVQYCSQLWSKQHTENAQGDQLPNAWARLWRSLQGKPFNKGIQRWAVSVLCGIARS